MPEHIRALIVILILSSVIFAFAKRPVGKISNYGDFTRRRNLWLAITLIAFLAHSFWLYACIVGPLLLYSSKRETNKAALFFFLLFTLPVANAYILGMGLVTYLFSLTHPRLLALVILLPAFFHLISQRERQPFGRTTPDKLLAGYMLLIAALSLRETSITDSLRQSFYLFTDIFLPYFVISRSLKDLQSFRDALLSLVIAAMILALIGIFETHQHWLLYNPLIDALELKRAMIGYLERANALRAVASVGQPIVLGYVMTVAIGFYLFLQHSIQNKLTRRFGMALLVAGLITALSRGPWVGAVALLVVFTATAPRAPRNLAILGLIALISLPLVATLPGGQKVIDLIPLIGTAESENITYRKTLINNSLIVIQRNPWLGSVNYMESPELEAMRQGQGIIDIVNSYLRITLESGFIGLGLFTGFFLLVLWGIASNLRRIPDKECIDHLLGRALLATLVGIMVIIFTVSSITVIPIVYWSVAALGVAYNEMIKKNKKLLANPGSTRDIPPVSDY
ncbi:MAG: O-antigen ligase family protein [Candidatus Sedimenticola sp. (ex Thyasira tokunagai)]